MKTTYQIPSTPLFTFPQLAYHLRIDSDLQTDDNERDYVMDLQSAAIAFAEEQMQCSLISRTITATYYTDDGNTSTYPLFIGSNYLLPLPRGPIQSITSVADARQAFTNWTQQSYGHRDCIALPSVFTSPLTVIYVAGYGDTPAAIPADIRQAIRSHVDTLYNHRASVTATPLSVVPHSLEAFYQRKARSLGIM